MVNKKESIMKKSFLNVFLLIILCGIIISCQKEEIVTNGSTNGSTQEQLVVTTKSTSMWNYYTASVPAQINHSITSGNFMLEVSNSGTRIVTVSVYPKNGSNVDYGNRITIFPVDINLGYCVIRYLSLPSGYDGILITLTKNSSTGGYISGTIAVTK